VDRNPATDPVARELIQASLSAKHARRIRSLLTLLLFVVDTLMAALAFAVGHAMRELVPLAPLPPDPPGLEFYLPTIALHLASVLFSMYFARLYHLPRAVSRFDVSYRVLAAVSLGVFLSVAFQAVFLKNTPFETDYPRTLLVYVWSFSVLLVIVGREFHRQVADRLRARGVGRDEVLIVGDGEPARSIVQKIQWSPQLGFNLTGLVTESGRGNVLGVAAIGSYGDLPRLIDEFQIGHVIIALPDTSHRQLVNLITLCQRGQVDIKVYPDLFAYMAGGLSVDDLGGLPLLSVRDVALRGWRLSLKRLMDLAGAAFGLVFLSPLLLALAVVVRYSSPGPVFFCQTRMGLDGRPFPMIKFRTMRQDAEKDGPGWTVPNDPRVTKVGRFLRRTNIDELPQLINVLLGQMSLVGPRPEQQAYVERFRSYIPRYMERHQMKAGMTGWAQVNGLRGDTSVQERTKYDLYYVENWSLWLDVKILIRTVIQMLTGRSPNAY